MGLFGGGTQKTEVKGWKPATQALGKTFLPAVDDYYNQYGGGEGIYQGSQLADLDPLVTQAQEMQLGTLDRMGGQMGNVQNKLQGFLNYNPNNPINQARRDAYTNSVLDQFNTKVLPGIRQQGTFMGQYGGPQQDLVTGEALGDLGRDLAGFEAQMMEDDRNRAFSAMSMAPSLFAQTNLMPGQVMGDVGMQRSLRGQQELANQIQMYEAPRRAELQGLLEYQNMVAPLTGTATSTSGGGGGGGLQGALGGGLSAFAASGGNPWMTGLGALGGLLG